MALYIVATPLGNLRDITLRALDTLKNVDLIACEDTRKTRKLLSHYDIHTTVTSYNEYNRRKKEPYLIDRLKKGEKIALVSNAGTPTISDPGNSLVREAIEQRIKVVPVPGPSALIAALSISGFSGKGFIFGGWVSRKQSKLRRELANFSRLNQPLVIYESPRRLLKTLKVVKEVCGEVELSIARELTKIYEENIRGKVSEVIARLASRDNIKGEITIIINAPKTLVTKTRKEKPLIN